MAKVVPQRMIKERHELGLLGGVKYVESCEVIKARRGSVRHQEGRELAHHQTMLSKQKKSWRHGNVATDDVTDPRATSDEKRSPTTAEFSAIKFW
jgi:hypothetical protein